MVTQAQKAFLIRRLIESTSVPVVLDADHCAKAGAWACLETNMRDGIKIYVSDIGDLHALAHEYVHVFQLLTGRYYFKLPELEEYLLNIGLTPDEEFLQQTFLPHWRKVTSEGHYFHEEFSAELPAYYVEYAENGWQFFQHLCRDAKLF